MVLLRAADRRQHRREDLGAVLQVVDAVAVDDRGPEQDADLAAELRVIDPVAMLELALDTALATGEVERENGCDDAEKRPHQH